MNYYNNIVYNYCSIQRWLKLASAYAESPIRVGCLEWPLKISPLHALQLQAAAAFRLITPVKSRHSQPGASSLLLHKLPPKSLNPARHDSGIWNNMLRYTVHLSGTSVCSEDHTPSLMEEAYRLARKHGNLKLATSLIIGHIYSLIDSDYEPTEIGLPSAVDTLKQCKKITPQGRFQVMRDLSKLFVSLQQNNQAVDTLATSMSEYCSTLGEVSQSVSTSNEMVGRSLLTLVKWLQSDSRLLALLWRTDFEMGKKLDTLLMQEVECRKKGMGLYNGDGSSRAWELFQPDESVARYSVIVLYSLIAHYIHVNV